MLVDIEIGILVGGERRTEGSSLVGGSGGKSSFVCPPRAIVTTFSVLQPAQKTLRNIAVVTYIIELLAHAILRRSPPSTDDATLNYQQPECLIILYTKLQKLCQ